MSISTAASASATCSASAASLLSAGGASAAGYAGRPWEVSQEIAAASAEQSESVTQIGGAMGQLSKATQQNASASEELAATSEELSGQAQQGQKGVVARHRCRGAAASSEWRFARIPA